MGKLSHDLHIQHFSHPHLLELTNPLTLNITPCSGCKLQSSGWMYTCKPCNFTLHTSCSQLPQLITHPAHPGHPLTLLPTPAYPVGCFNCDACAYTNTTRQATIQFQPRNSYPGRNNLQYGNGPVQMNNQYYMQTSQSQNNATAMSGNALMDAAVQGFAEGAGQQVGQNFVQSLMGDDSNNGSNGNNGNNNNSSSSILDIGSSLLSGMLGTS
ncbi:DC1 - like 10 [Theobroma cacao]|nr:DC1 - like 10 [Theobroma cacao]